MFDEDIKIAMPRGQKAQSESAHEEYDRESSKGNTEKARILGTKLADEVVEKINTFATVNEDSVSSEMDIQRGILMTFAATVGVETALKSSVVSQAAKISFNSELEKRSPSLYKAVADSGAYSFYYLAYRRGTEVDRRIGQTFAMLCSHDGDPVYQELGEAIYCWFASVTAKAISNSGLL
jgi:hypothetical protein